MNSIFKLADDNGVHPVSLISPRLAVHLRFSPRFATTNRARRQPGGLGRQPQRSGIYTPIQTPEHTSIITDVSVRLTQWGLQRRPLRLPAAQAPTGWTWLPVAGHRQRARHIV